MRSISPLLALLALGCRPPETGPGPNGGPINLDATPTFLGSGGQGAPGGPGVGPGGSGGPDAGGESTEGGERRAPPWESKGTVQATGTLRLTGPVTGSCCGSAKSEWEGSPLRFYVAPADPGQRDGWVALLGKGDQAALLGMTGRDAYNTDLWRAATKASKAGDVVTLEIPADALPKMALRVWPGSPGTVTIGDVEIAQSEQGATIPYVVVLPPGTTAPSDTAPSSEATPGGDPSKEPPSGETAGALEQSGGKGPDGAEPGGDPKAAEPKGGTAPPAGKPGETPAP